MEYKERELVLINAHSLLLLKLEKGRGRNLSMRYDSPSQIIKKLSPVSYQFTNASFLWNSPSNKHRSFGKISTFSPRTW